MDFSSDKLALLAFGVIGCFALLGAVDYIIDSVKMFISALKKYRKHDGD